MSIFSKIQRKSETNKLIGWSRSTLHVRIKDGLFPPPINLGGRAVGFLESETESIIRAMAAGKTKSEIRVLVNSLIKQRENALEVQ